ncbi:immunoglobulin domain-containing protein [Engraulis encrasicolus]|uniref:immunoglobulin domain-containing protein n=1 Tax=Engraulis encrasicolus TaxID=184585 RepID=UPI002FD12F93
MAQGLTPRKSIICALMICVFPHAGISNKALLSISQTTEGGTFLLTCRLSLTGGTKVSQTGWAMVAGPNNRTNLATDHPLFGTHILPQYREQVQMGSESSSEPNTTTTTILRLTDWQTNLTDRFCCAFHTFPSGKLERCISIRQSNAESDVLTPQNVMAQSDQRLASRVIILAGGAVLALGLLSMSIFFCWRSSFKRWGVFEVESAHSAEAQPEAEVQAESAPQPTGNLGFDPSKLYAKIKQDLYYGRLWKSYQGRPQTREPGGGPPATAPRKVYSFVGEHSPAQKNQEEP